VDATGKACLLKAIQERPDLTLAELQVILLEQQGVRLCIAQVANVLKRLGMRLKKSRSTPPSATPMPTVRSGVSSSSAFVQRRRNT
jgi:transposase